MSQFNSKLMEGLSQAFGPSGEEGEIRDFITSEIKEHVDSLKVDNLGNLIAHKKGSGKKIMLMAHMDQIGVIVTDIDKEGTLKFSEIGGANPEIYLGQRIVFKNGTEGVIASSKGEKKGKTEIKHLYIDLGLLTKEASSKRVNIGDMGVFKSDYYETESSVVCKCADDRVGCYTLIEMLKSPLKTDNDVYYVFTVQEELGARGAKPVAYDINPDVALAIDVTFCGGSPEDHKVAVKMGDGASVKIKDGSILSHIDVRTKLIELAENNSIKYQLEIIERGGTDVGTAHLVRCGIPSGGVSIPTRYVHTPHEIFSKFDVSEAIKLLLAFISS